MTKAIADALDARIEDASTGLNATCIKGMPNWDRPNISSPLAAIMWVSDEASPEQRVGAVVNRQMTRFALTVYASSELALWGLVDSTRSMFKNWTSATISNKTVHIRTVEEYSRIETADAPEQLRYAFQTLVEFEYVI